ncbi:MAG: PAS domain S-box protein [Leptolyngbyaceae cyanobacterium bins.302]|nr:PAS domain S-box protein [Leptolyngbyaceae cyanobacterium bins.302]
MTHPTEHRQSSGFSSEFSRQVQAAQTRLAQLQQQATAPHAAFQSLLQDTIAELSISLEELHVAGEELHQQQEELLTTQQELELERQRYQNLFDFAPDAYLVTDERGIIQNANAAAADLFQVRHDFLVGKPLTLFIARPDHDFIYAELRQIAASAPRIRRQTLHQPTMSPVQFPTASPEAILFLQDQAVSVQPRDQAAFPAALALSGECDAQGQIIRLYWLLRDLRERQQAEAKLRESEERYRTLFESIDEGFCMIEMVFDENDTPIDYRFLEVNPQFEHQTGLSQVVGQRILELVPGHEPDWFEIYGKIALTGEPLRFEHEASALHRWYDVYAFRVGQPEQRRVGVLFRDISDRKRTEQKIQEQAALLDITSDAISVRDLDHRIFYWNRGAAQLYGWTATEAIGQIAPELLHVDPDRLAEITPILLAEGEWRGELHKTTKTGKVVTVESRTTLMRDAAHQPQAILAVETDITEKKQLEAQFYRAQRLESLGTLASGIAHDLNNVLTPVLAISQILRSQQPDLNPRAREMLQVLENSAKRGTNLVKQILTFTRGTGGERHPVQVSAVVQEVVSLVQQSFSKTITIHQTIPDPCPWIVLADPTYLHQILMNLCVNARDAMPKGGTLSLAVEHCVVDRAWTQTILDVQPGNYVVITIADTGSGIPPEVRDRIFDPFFTTKPLGQGTGLGLATVLGIVKEYGGFLQVLSEVDRGTEMKVYLPTIEEAPTPSEPSEQQFDGNGELILIVDDDVAVQRSTQSLLENHHYTVLSTHDGMEAIALYTEHQSEIRLVILDIMMPTISGITLIQRLRAINPTVKIIAMSGLPVNREPALAAGANAFLPKPYTVENLLENLQALIARKQ